MRQTVIAVTSALSVAQLAHPNQPRRTCTRFCLFMYLYDIIPLLQGLSLQPLQESPWIEQLPCATALQHARNGGSDGQNTALHVSELLSGGVKGFGVRSRGQSVNRGPIPHVQKSVTIFPLSAVVPEVNAVTLQVLYHRVEVEHVQDCQSTLYRSCRELTLWRFNNSSALPRWVDTHLDTPNSYCSFRSVHPQDGCRNIYVTAHACAGFPGSPLSPAATACTGLCGRLLVSSTKRRRSACLDCRLARTAGPPGCSIAGCLVCSA